MQDAALDRRVLRRMFQYVEARGVLHVVWLKVRLPNTPQRSSTKALLPVDSHTSAPFLRGEVTLFLQDENKDQLIELPT